MRGPPSAGVICKAPPRRGSREAFVGGASRECRGWPDGSGRASKRQLLDPLPSEVVFGAPHRRGAGETCWIALGPVYFVGISATKAQPAARGPRVPSPCDGGSSQQRWMRFFGFYLNEPRILKI